MNERTDNCKTNSLWWTLFRQVCLRWRSASHVLKVPHRCLIVSCSIHCRPPQNLVLRSA